MKYISIFLIKLYKLFISPFLPNSCRFEPTCSEYAIQAFKKFGFLKGILFSIKRIMRCNPFIPEGNDPIH